MEYPLTPTQLETLQFLVRYQENFRTAPTHREIAEAFGISQPAVNDRLMILERNGAIKRVKHRPRAIKILWRAT